MSDAPAGLSMDQAVAALEGIPDVAASEPSAPEAQAEQTTESTEGAQTLEEVDAPETASIDGEAEQVEPVAPAIDPPAFWDEQAKTEFATYPPEMQQKIAERWKDGERTISAKLEEAATARKAAEATTAEIGKLKAELDTLVPQARQTFDSKWAAVTPEMWAQWAQQDPEACMQGRMQFEAEKAQVQRLETAQQQATEQSHKAFVAAQVPEMARLIPELAGPKAKETMDAMVAYARNEGATQDQLQWASAKEWSVIDKARRWDESQAKLTASPSKPVAAAPVRPGAAQPASAPQQRTRVAAMSNLRSNGGTDAAVAALKALGL